MMDKYRVHEVAKDLNVPSKDVVNLLGEHFEEPKKHMTALSEQELNVVFEHYTQGAQVENFDEYFAAGDKKNQSKDAPAPKADAPKADAPKTDAPKTDAPKTDAPKTDAPKTDAPKTDAPKADAPKTDAPTTDAPKTADTHGTAANADAPTTDAPATPAPTQTYRNRPQGGYNNNNQSTGYQGSRPQGDRPQGTTGYQGNNQSTGYQGSRPQGDRPQGTTGYQGNNQSTGYQGSRPQGTGYQGNNQSGGYQNRPQGDRPQGSYNNNQSGGYQSRPQGSYNNNRTDGNKPQSGYNNQNNEAARAQANFGVQKQETYKVEGGFNAQRAEGGKPKNTAPRPTTTNTAPKTTTGEAGTRIVDMRAAHVELDKYNERYEQIAPTNIAPKAKDTDVKKQKLNQRSAARRGKPVKSRKEQEAEKMRRLELERQRRQKLEVTLPEEISVGELAAKLKIQSSEIVKRLMTLGIMASVSQIIDYDTACLVAIEIGAKVSPEVIVTIEDRLFVIEDEAEINLTERSPVVVVMGHVDHGKTSLLDAIRNTNVTTGEAGGITQHIGAYQITTANNKKITFLDTPGHAAFTSMRARGAQVTDIAVLVVAADDGIMPQTVEAINHAKAAGVPIIVAINKMDKPGANPEKIKQALTEHELVVEEWGGDVICVPISAKTGENLPALLEMIQLAADVRELKANPDRLAKGTVIEANLDKGRGPVATILIQNGTLRTGDVIIAGTALGRVRVMLDDKGNKIDEAGPSTPVSITGLSEVPSAGDIFNSVEDERLAKELVDQRRHEAKEEVFKTYQKVTLDNLFDHISDGDIKELPIIIKADVQGSVEAVKQSLEKLNNGEVRVKVIHGAVGAVSESDVMLADASNAIIVGFNVRPEVMARESAERSQVDIRLYRIIYDAIEEIESAMKGMLAPKTREVDLGRAEVRNVFKITNVGVVAGCYVTEGKITRNANIRIVRDGIIVADDKLDSLKRFKDDVREVARGYECGMSLTKFNDLKEGDFFEAYEIEEYRD